MTYAGLPVVIVFRFSGPKVVEVKMSSKTLLHYETSSLRHPNNRLSAHMEQLPFNYKVRRSRGLALASAASSFVTWVCS